MKSSQCCSSKLMSGVTSRQSLSDGFLEPTEHLIDINGNTVLDALRNGRERERQRVRLQPAQRWVTPKFVVHGDPRQLRNLLCQSIAERDTQGLKLPGLVLRDPPIVKDRLDDSQLTGDRVVRRCVVEMTHDPIAVLAKSIRIVIVQGLDDLGHTMSLGVTPNAAVQRPHADV